MASIESCLIGGNCTWKDRDICREDCVAAERSCPLRIEEECGLKEEREPCSEATCFIKGEISPKGIVDFETARIEGQRMCRAAGASLRRALGMG